MHQGRTRITGIAVMALATMTLGARDQATSSHGTSAPLWAIPVLESGQIWAEGHFGDQQWRITQAADRHLIVEGELRGWAMANSYLPNAFDVYAGSERKAKIGRAAIEWPRHYVREGERIVAGITVSLRLNDLQAVGHIERD